MLRCRDEKRPGADDRGHRAIHEAGAGRGAGDIWRPIGQ